MSGEYHDANPDAFVQNAVADIVRRSYAEFLASKAVSDAPTGLAIVPALGAHLFPYQHDIVAWALARGRAAIWADCGLGKGPMQLEWAKHVAAATGGRVLVLAPLAVAEQLLSEAAKFRIPLAYAESQAAADAIDCPIIVTNYERLAAFTPAAWVGVSADESSILKSLDGTTRTLLIEEFARTPFRLACTATPAPNDFMELGNHAEFLGVLTRVEMLSTFFVHDGGDTSEWRLKGHAEADFWRWLASWAVVLRKPSDLGYSDEGFVLPPLDVRQHVTGAPAPEGELFALEAQTLSERQRARKASTGERAALAAQLAADYAAAGDAVVVWCGLNAEAEAVTALVPGAVEVRGSDLRAEKLATLAAFQSGAVRVLVTKPSIAGFGLNWQHCHRVIFLGLSDSWEAYYQAIRRCWRFGQRAPVTVDVVTSEAEGAVVANIQRKEADAAQLADRMTASMRELSSEAVHGQTRQRDTYARETVSGGGWTAHLGDCVEVAREMPSESVDFSIFSPPFASLYTYSASDRDMGNCRDHETFYAHFQFLVAELYRLTKPGRLVSFHCMNLPTSKARDGVIGITDFRVDLIRAFQADGWVYHSEVCIWKDPVTAMQRTKALGLLHKTIRKDSSMSRQGIADYLVTMRKPGANAEPIAHTPEEFPVQLWQRYASPVWMDINPSDTLQYRSAREHDDERHICPLQLEVIRRALKLWSNPGDVVFSPFGGIGSEGVVALEEGRRALLIELKPSYFRQAVRNLTSATEHAGSDLFALSGNAEDAA